MTATDLCKEVLEKVLHHFGDKLYIKHAPLLQQEGDKKTPFHDRREVRVLTR
jgi:hypothetical protein